MKMDAVELGVGVFSAQGVRLCGFNSHDLRGKRFSFAAGKHEVVDCVVPRMNLSPGIYRLNLIMKKRDRMPLDLVEQAASFEVVPADVYGTGRIPAGSNLVFMEADWESTEAVEVPLSPVRG